MGTRCAFTLAISLALLAFVQGCDWTDDVINDFAENNLTGTIVGIIIVIIPLTLTSLPLCCGVMKDRDLKPMAIALGIVAGLCLLIPLITGSIAGAAAVNEFCDRCRATDGDECSEEDKRNARAAVLKLGVLIAYSRGLGFVVVILGGIAMSLACCMCCPCCGPLRAAKQQRGGPVPVVGPCLLDSAARRRGRDRGAVEAGMPKRVCEFTTGRGIRPLLPPLSSGLCGPPSPTAGELPPR